MGTERLESGTGQVETAAPRQSSAYCTDPGDKNNARYDGLMHRLLFVAAAATALLLPAAHGTAAGPVTRADYDNLSGHRLGPVQAVPSTGLAWTIDTADWTLESGRIRLQEATAGVVPGLWFEGHGRLEMAIPDAVELRQLRRLLDEPELDRLALDFDRMVLRSSGGQPTSELPSPGPGGDLEADYERRHDHYSRIRRLDVDSRVLAALGEPGALYWQADIRTPDHNWVTFIYDSQQAEEIRVEHFDSGYGFLESWVSLDRAADRTATGRPTSTPLPVFDVEHVSIAADLTAAARKYPGWIDAVLQTEVDLRVLKDGVSALPFHLDSRAKITRVAGTDDADLEFVRDHIGGRVGSIDDEIHDRSLLVLLPGPAVEGSRISLRIDYELRLPRYAGGRLWYPGHPDAGGLHDRHTARFELTTDDRHELQAMGELVEERETKGRKTSIWQLDQPAKMVTFAMQKGQYAKTTEKEGLPTVTTVGGLGDRLSGLNERRIDRVAADTINAIDYLQQVLDWPLTDTHLYAALIPSSHGQAFPGFLHLGEFTAVVDTVAAVELFRAHEVAHQWWGHLVGWNSYRDQWLTEGFAEYMGLMYVHDAVENGPKMFQEAITAFSNEVQGSLETVFSRFARPGNTLLTARGAERVGPIGHGWRAAIGETPTAYQTLAYSKGALVLHMLRRTTEHMTGSDDAFIAILRDFVKSNAGRFASTEDFRAAVERQVPADWTWFFDQWVYGAEIPTYAWDYEVTPTAGGVTLKLTVEQRDVSPGFKMMVPVQIEFGKKQRGELTVFVDEPLETFEFELPSKPRRVHFNAGDVVIAKVKKR